MFTVRTITDPAEKERISLATMEKLPEWFSPPESLPHKAQEHRDMHFFAAFSEEECIGFLALKIHNAYTAEIHTLGLLKPYHRMGTGHSLLHAAEAVCKERGLRFLTVKTLDASADYKPYERSRAFYRKAGFLPLEVLPTYWDEDNPCLYLLKVLA